MCVTLLIAQLVLRDNDIDTVPKGLYKCTRLRTLHLQVNQINVLPPEISKSLYIKLPNPYRSIPFIATQYYSNYLHRAFIIGGFHLYIKPRYSEYIACAINIDLIL